MTTTGTGCTYWELSPQEREEYCLPRFFNKEHYNLMHIFLSERPIHNPPNQHDTQNLGTEDYVQQSLEEILCMVQIDDEVLTFDNEDPIT
jgi:hypothetical protein